MRIPTRRGVAGLIAGALLWGAGAARAQDASADADADAIAERIVVVMFRRAGCPWCHAWDREIGGAWEKTEIGSTEPMLMVDLDRDPMPEIALARPARYTPTFVVALDGVETSRIEGYPGQDFFWGLIEKAIGEAQAAARATPPPGTR